MEALIAGLGIAAGAGWGVAGGLAVALLVALRLGPRPPRLPSENSMRLDEAQAQDFPNFGHRRAS